MGRFTHSETSPDQPTQRLDYRHHVRGWNAAYFDNDIAPRVFELTVNNIYQARLRIDRPPGGGFTGRFKSYSSPYGEDLEYDLKVDSLDGTHLVFTRYGGDFVQSYSGMVQGRTISGTFTHNGAGAYPWSGTRAEVLTYGLSEKSPADRAAWQAQTRRMLEHLMMAGNPPPLTRKVDVLRSHIAPVNVPTDRLPPNRDDDPTAWPPNYSLTELRFTYTLPNPYDPGQPMTRQAHAYLAVPKGIPSGAKLPVVLALNGHGGSAWQVMSGDNSLFWYGDSFARHGYIVLAIDMSHRNDSPLYSDGYSNGDDPANGNGPHSSIKAAGFDTDWEENGERAWDVMRAVDYLLTHPNVDPHRVIVTGLSLGGEMTTVSAAMDPRIAMGITSGFSADYGVLAHNGAHACWQWVYADIREYIDDTDLHALVAPRPFVVQFGKQDYLFSSRNPPFSVDKQAARRARPAYADQPQNYVHYLHYDEHRYHIGSANPNRDTEQGVRVARVAAPESPSSLAWQTNGETESIAPSLYDLIDALLKR
ncbi:alpha/beta hydrolase family protein [Methylomagnum sp.]